MNNIVKRSTDPVVRILLDKFGALERGATIAHAELESLIGSARNTNRYRTVVGSFKRAMLREKGILCKARVGEGYELLVGDLQIKAAGGLVRQAARRLYRGLDVATRTPEHLLGADQRRAREYMLTSGSLLLQHVRDGARKMEMALPEAKK